MYVPALTHEYPFPFDRSLIIGSKGADVKKANVPSPSLRNLRPTTHLYIIGFFLFAILQIPTALSPTYPGLIVTRFITGCVAGIPISNVGASAADLFPTVQTAWPVMLFSFGSQVLGPNLGVRHFNTCSIFQADFAISAHNRGCCLRDKRESQMVIPGPPDLRDDSLCLVSRLRGNATRQVL